LESTEKPKKKKSSKIILILIIAFVLVPLGVGCVVYNTNKSFRDKMNTKLIKAPGFVGKYFRNYPTESEKQDKKTYLANYYLSLDPSRAADKIYIVKKNDEELFDDIIRIMNEMSPSKTSEILKLVRSIELRKDLLFSIYDEIQEEKQNQLKDEISRLEKNDILVSINEIEKRVAEESGYLEKLPNIINFMDEDKASTILYYLDENIVNAVLPKLEAEKKSKLQNRMLIKEIEDKKLRDLASLYEAKPLDTAIEEIGNEETYSMDKLGSIYMNLSVKKAAEILSNVEDDNFTEEIFTVIRREEQLKKVEDSKTIDISEAIQFVSEYNRKIDELVGIYEKMSPDAIAKIVENMMDNTKTVTSLEINSTPIYEISDSTIIIDVLSKMKKPTVSKIINNMNTKKATQLTQLLAKP
jgi:flagellar motility protein MotE (MotC chaperone)